MAEAGIYRNESTQTRKATVIKASREALTTPRFVPFPVICFMASSTVIYVGVGDKEERMALLAFYAKSRTRVQRTHDASTQNPLTAKYLAMFDKIHDLLHLGWISRGITTRRRQMIRVNR